MFSRRFQAIYIIFLGLIVAVEATLLIAGFFGNFTLKAALQARSEPKKITVVVAPKDRIDDVNRIVKALSEYNEARRTYPRTLQDLVPNYLTGPNNPAVGFSQYIYVPIGEPIENYTLTYALSADYGDYLQGTHAASEKGLVGGEYPLSGSDLDNDGVDDAVEIYIYRTDSQNADTDNDGFTDGVEIASGHNPRGK